MVELEIETDDETTPAGKAFLCDNLFHIIDNERHKGELDADDASVNSVAVGIVND